MATVIELLEGQIQSRIGTFLQKKEVLQKLIFYAEPIKSKASELLSKQNFLEGKLREVLVIIDNVKAGNATVADATVATTFYLDMDKHISNVNKLQDEAKGVTPPLTEQVNVPLIAGLAMVGVAALLWFRK